MAWLYNYTLNISPSLNFWWILYEEKNSNLIFDSFYFNNIDDTILLRLILFSTVTPDV